MNSLLNSKLYQCCTVVGGTFGYLIGGYTMAVKTLLILMVADVLSQLIVASVFVNSPKSNSGGLNSNACRQGIYRKIMVLLCIVVAYRLEVTLNIPAIKDMTVMGFAISEAISILENAGEMGIKLPKKLKECIDVLREQESGNNDTNK